MPFWNNRKNFDRDEKTKKSRHARFLIPLPWSKKKETGTSFESQPIHSTQIYDRSINDEQIRRLESMAPSVATSNAPITISEPTVDGHSREEEKAQEEEKAREVERQWAEIREWKKRELDPSFTTQYSYRTHTSTLQTSGAKSNDRPKTCGRCLGFLTSNGYSSELCRCWQ